MFISHLNEFELITRSIKEVRCDIRVLEGIDESRLENRFVEKALLSVVLIDGEEIRIDPENRGKYIVNMGFPDPVRLYNRFLEING